MNIRTKLNLSFAILVISVAVAGAVGIFATHEVIENYEINEKISDLLSIQRKMNTLIAEAIASSELSQLEIRQQQFNQLLDEFHKTAQISIEDEESEASESGAYAFVESFFGEKPNQGASLIQELIGNELEMEQIGKVIFTIHKEKLQQNSVFLQNYPLERDQRKSIRKTIFRLPDGKLIKDMGDVQYYSKETLYQHRDKGHLDQWLGAIDLVRDQLRNPLLGISDEEKKQVLKELGKYANTASIMGEIAIAARETEALEQQKISEFQERLRANEEASVRAKATLDQTAKELTQNLSVIQIIFIVIMVACAFVLSTYISRAVSHSVVRLKEGVQHIREGDLTIRIELQTDDEFNGLARAFNDMTDDLKTAHNALEEYNRNLEKTVTERTQELNEQKNMMEALAAKLSKYLSPQVYQSIFSGKKDVTHETYRKQLTIFFSDIKGFTELTDSLESETLAKVLNEYLNEMAQIALSYEGTIDKFIGDAIMIFFGDPDTKGEQRDAINCVRMALEMRERMKSLREKWDAQGISTPLRIRMGINTGFCTVGNFGSDDRLDYTIVGGQVNLASRLESNAEPDQILISHETYALIRKEIACKKKDAIKVKGIAYPVQTYQVIDTEETLQNTQRQLTKNFDGFSLSVDLNRSDRAQVLKTLQTTIDELKG